MTFIREPRNAGAAPAMSASSSAHPRPMAAANTHNAIDSTLHVRHELGIVGLRASSRVALTAFVASKPVQVAYDNANSQCFVNRILMTN